jgi:hypothetical protein
MALVKKKRTRIKNRDQSRDYVNGPTLQKNLVEWYNSGEEKIPDIIVLAIFQIVERLGTKGCFNGYSYLDDMKGDALEKCIAALNKKQYKAFEYDNPFAYFSQIANNAFVNMINIESRQSYLKQKSLVNHNHNEMMMTGQAVSQANEDFVDNDIISKFESKIKRKKEKKKKLTEFEVDANE